MTGRSSAMQNLLISSSQIELQGVTQNGFHRMAVHVSFGKQNVAHIYNSSRNRWPGFFLYMHA
jgi:hypothetical protein